MSELLADTRPILIGSKGVGVRPSNGATRFAKSAIGDEMKALVSAIFGFALIINAALFVPQAWHLWKAKRAEGISIPAFLGFCAIQFVGTLDGHYQHDEALLIGMAMSLLTCGSATGLAIYYSLLNRTAQGWR